jgi:putative acetyltransferase
MKICRLMPENYARVIALLQQTFPGSRYEEQLVINLHNNKKPLYEWICIQSGRTVAYIAFSNAYYRARICGLHLAPLAVHPKNQNLGIGSELLRFALRQDAIKESTIYVLGNPGFYQKFGFQHCSMPVCPFDKNNAHFSSIRNNTTQKYTVGYEPEFKNGTGKSIL